jgi:hypothetical protein
MSVANDDLWHAGLQIRTVTNKCNMGKIGAFEFARNNLFRLGIMTPSARKGNSAFARSLP